MNLYTWDNGEDYEDDWGYIVIAESLEEAKGLAAKEGLPTANIQNPLSAQGGNRDISMWEEHPIVKGVVT